MARCPGEQRTLLRRRYAPNGEHLLFYVGRIVYEKGLHVLISRPAAHPGGIPGYRACWSPARMARNTGRWPID